MFEQIVILDQTGLQDWALDELENVSRLPLRIYESDPESKNDIIGRIGLADCVFLSWRTKLSSAVLSQCKSLNYVGMCCSLYSPESANVDIEYALENDIVVKGIRDYGDERMISTEVVSGWTREARERLSRKVIDNVLGGAKKITLLLIFLTLCFWQVNGQDITYGSNDGQHVNISGTKIYYEEYGSGAALFLLHGGFGSIHDFQQVIPELANHFRVIAVDSPGHGRSEQADSLSFELMANYVSEMIDLLHLDSLYIIGYSDGGNTALLLSNRRPDKVKRVVASGANSKMSGLTPEVLGYLEMVNPEFIEAYQQEWLMDYMSKSPEKDKWKKYIADMINMYSNEVIIDNKQLANISGRVLLLYGDRDVIKLEHGLEIYNAIPESRFCVLPNTPHEVFSANPALANKIGIAFLKE